MRSAKATNVDLEGWACEVMEKITGKPHQRSRSSVLNPLQQAPSRPVSRVDGPAPRRPSQANSDASSRRPSAVSIESGRRPSGAEGSPRHAAPFPARSSSHAPTRSTSSNEGASPTSGIDRMMMPPPGGRSDRERDREAQRAYAYRQGTIGIAFDGGAGAPPTPPAKEEKRRAPMTTMTSGGNGAGMGVANGWDRSR
jgi:hypothetical protein